MTLICTQCGSPLTAMTVSKENVKASCEKCMGELTELREVVADLRKVMKAYPELVDG
jgi:predicted nucleic acid-binding Zn ribbon protein